MQVECADGGAYNVAVGEGYDFIPNKFVEIMGHLENGETPLSVRCCVSCVFVLRERPSQLRLPPFQYYV